MEVDEFRRDIGRDYECARFVGEVGDVSVIYFNAAATGFDSDFRHYFDLLTAAVRRVGFDASTVRAMRVVSSSILLSSIDCTAAMSA
ncbi:MAG TPA: hypothetical protein VFE60_18780 [Roseiarcus sp.]|nr:hypothetical protein [Roseiarcus sp.]